MKKALLSFALVSATVLGASAGVNDPTGMSLRGDFSQAYNPQYEFKYGDADNSWIYLAVDNGLNFTNWFAIGDENWNGEKTIIVAQNNDQARNGQADGNNWKYTIAYGGGNNAFWPSNFTTKAIKVILPKNKSVWGSENNGNFPTDPNDMGTMILYREIPEEISSIRVVRPIDSAHDLMLCTEIDGYWNTSTYPMTAFEWDDNGTTKVGYKTKINKHNANFAISDRTNGQWIVGLNNTAPQANTRERCFYGGERNIKWVKDVIEVILWELPTNTPNGANDPGSGYGYIEQVTNKYVDKQSLFSMEAWLLGQGNAWDSSGGLAAPFNDHHYEGYVTNKAGDRELIDVKGAYPLSEQFIRTSSDGKNYLSFYGPLTDEEINEINAPYIKEGEPPHAVKWASDAWTKDLGYDREQYTDLYVVDFTKGKDNQTLKGLYILAPKVKDMDAGNNDNIYKDVDYFYRMGVHFYLLDEAYGEDDGINLNYDRHFQWMKWGHAFRINEKSRPAAAFPVLNAEGNKVIGFTDKFGPNSWNGWAYKQNLPGKEGYTDDNGEAFDAHNIQDKISKEGESKLRDKEGDSKILAERNFWLKRIFLEVAKIGTDEKGRAINRVYVYFDGVYDLDALNEHSFSTDYYVSANLNDTRKDKEGNTDVDFVTPTPNIWHGVNVAAGEPTFNRFYNLNLDDKNLKDMIGLTRDEYLDRTGEHNYLYNLEFTDTYSVVSDYKVMDKDGIEVTYQGTGKASKMLGYKAENGVFTQMDLDENGDITDVPIKVLSTIPDKSDEYRKMIVGLNVDVLADPESPTHNNPANAEITSKFKFVNMAFPTKMVNNYKFDNKHVEEDATLTINKDESKTHSRVANENSKEYTLAADWNNYTSILKYSGLSWADATNGTESQPEDGTDAQSEDGTDAQSKMDPMPVAVYKYGYVIDQNAEAPEDGYDEVGPNFKREGKTFTDVLNVANDKAANSYVHYKVDAYYNICYPTSGMLRTERLFADNDRIDVSTLLTYDENEDKTVERRYEKVKIYDPAKYNSYEESVANGNKNIHDVLNTSDKEGVSFRISPVKHTGYVTFNLNEVPTGIESVMDNQDMAPRYFDLQGYEVVNPQAGRIYIVKRGAKVVKEMVK